MTSRSCRGSVFGRAALALGIALAIPVRAQTPPPAAPEVTVAVNALRVEGNTLLPMPEIDCRLEPFKGAATMPRLRDAATAAQEMYRAAGYGGVVAYLPEQDLGAGAVRIRVVEGRL